ncbi:MAG: hypothetical protein IPL39_22715 [Opitutaceae bacterium]|nr:hypothetical protein [Opitutaceae bacterium]
MNAIRFFCLVMVLIPLGAVSADPLANRFGEIEGRIQAHFAGKAYTAEPIETLAFENWARSLKGQNASLVSADRDAAFRSSLEAFHVSIRRTGARTMYQVGQLKPIDGNVRTILLTFLVEESVVQRVLVARSID